MWIALLENDDVHVVPHNDLIEHEHNAECVCMPNLDYMDKESKIYTHHSLDGRELNEPGFNG